MRGTRVGARAVWHCAVASTLAFLLVPAGEVVARWRRTLVYAIAAAAAVIGMRGGWGLSWWAAVPAGMVGTVAAATVASVIVFRFTCVDAWHARSGWDAAWIQCSRAGRRGGYQLHSWSSWRHGQGLGRAVAEAALAQAPRPLWVEPATVGLRQLYLEHGALPGEGEARWVVFPVSDSAGITTSGRG